MSLWTEKKEAIHTLSIIPALSGSDEGGAQGKADDSRFFATRLGSSAVNPRA
jgi:hypothetical protein